MNILSFIGAVGLAASVSTPISKNAAGPTISPGDEVAVNFDLSASSVSISRFVNNNTRYATGNNLVATEWLPDLYSAIDNQYLDINANYEALSLDYDNTTIKNAILTNNAYETGTLGSSNVSFSNDLLKTSLFGDSQTTAELFNSVTNVTVSAGTSVKTDASTLINRFGTTDVEKYINTGDLTFLPDYGTTTLAVVQDYFGLTWSSKFISNVFNTTHGLDFYRYSITFPNGYRINDFNPIAIGLHSYKAYYTLGNYVTGYFEAVSGLENVSLNNVFTPTPSYPGGVALSYDSANIDGGAYTMLNNIYDNTLIYRIDIYTNEIPTYLLYNSMNAYYMAQYAGYASGYAVASNTGADYITGYNDGYEAGKAIGGDNQLVGPFSLIAGAFNAVASVFNLHVFGSITLGTFVFIPVIVMLIVVLVKLFRG